MKYALYALYALARWGLGMADLVFDRLFAARVSPFPVIVLLGL
ncbi:MAG: hypothetical protein ABR592_00250 [Nitriliruptorales bacterium]